MAEGANASRSDVVKTAGEVFGLIAGAIALVYAAGGGTLVLRLSLKESQTGAGSR
jgi:hypothetical protein